MKRGISATSPNKLQRVPCLAHQSGEPESGGFCSPNPAPFPAHTPPALSSAP